MSWHKITLNNAHCFIHYHTAQNFGKFGAVRKLVETILATDHTNNSYLQNLADKTLADCLLSSKSAKVFSRQSFVLYGNLLTNG